MARRKRASMREGPLADLFRATVDPEDPPEAPSPGSRPRDDDTSVMSSEAPAEPTPAPTPPSEPEPFDQVEEHYEPEPEPVSAVEPPPAKERLSRIFSEDV